MTAIALPPPPTQAEQAKTAAKQLEAFFLRQLLAEARPTGSSGIDGGFAGDTFKQMLDEALADKMSGAGGLGMAHMFEQQLTETPAPMPLVPRPLPMPVAKAPELGPVIDGAPQLMMPVIGRPSSGYGERIDPIHHTKGVHPGFDLAAPSGTGVEAAAPGEITHAGPAGTYGNLVIVRHENGFETRYAHLSRVDVKVGDRVTAGQAIGAVGSTGHSTGPHLHFEIRNHGKALDPKPYLPLHQRTNRATP